jgi:hypothetical protein
VSFDQKRTTPYAHIRRWDTCPNWSFRGRCEPQIGLFCHDTALPGVKDVFADDVR